MDQREDAAPRPDPDRGEPDADRGGSLPLRTCPNCGAELSDRSCKLVCPNRACGYFLSCSDYL